MEFNSRELSEKYGFKRDYFSVMKCTSRPKYDFIFSFDNRAEQSLLKYKTFIDNLFLEVEEIYNTFESSCKFSKWLYINKIYAYDNVGSQCLDKILYCRSENIFSIRLTAIRRLENIARKYKLANSF